MSCVIDASIMVSYLVKDETTDAVESIMAPLLVTLSHVPTLWVYELASALRVAERKQRISESDINSYLEAIQLLMVDHHHPKTEMIVEISRTTGLTPYDASYIALCIQLELPLVTLDKKMKAVAEQLGINVLS